MLFGVAEQTAALTDRCADRIQTAALTDLIASVRTPTPRGEKVKSSGACKRKAPPPIFERRCKGRGKNVLLAAHFVL